MGTTSAPRSANILNEIIAVGEKIAGEIPGAVKKASKKSKAALWSV